MIPDQFLDSEEDGGGNPEKCRAVPKKSKRKPKPRTAGSSPGLGFRFTADELRRIDSAIASAVRFMQKFGCGRQPYEIDLSHYENGIRKDNDRTPRRVHHDAE